MPMRKLTNLEQKNATYLSGLGIELGEGALGH